MIRNRYLHDGLLLLIGSVFYSVGIHAFVTPANIAPGGAAGISLLINFITGAPVGITTLLINAPLLILAWRYLSHRFAVMTLLASAVSNAMLDLVIAPICPVYSGDRFLGSLCGGILVGIGMAIIFRAGMTTGGTDILGYLFQKRFPHISIGNSLLVVDGVILLLSIGVFGDLEAAMFGLICLYAQIKLIDAILYGGESGSMAIIITNSAAADRIAERVVQEMERSATMLSGRGAYSKQEMDILLCVVRKSQFSRLKQIAHEVDPGVFLAVTETTSVFGCGFKSFEESI